MLFYSNNLDLLPPKPKLSFRYLKQGIQEFHRKYVLAPADKAANNVVVVWRLYYINTLKQELPRLGKRELILVLFVRLFGLCLFRFVGFLFLLGSGKGCGLWLWHSLDFSLTFFTFHHFQIPQFILLYIHLFGSIMRSCRQLFTSLFNNNNEFYQKWFKTLKFHSMSHEYKQVTVCIAND